MAAEHDVNRYCPERRAAVDVIHVVSKKLPALNVTGNIIFDKDIGPVVEQHFPGLFLGGDRLKHNTCLIQNCLIPVPLHAHDR